MSSGVSGFHRYFTGADCFMALDLARVIDLDESTVALTPVEKLVHHIVKSEMRPQSQGCDRLHRRSVPISL